MALLNLENNNYPDSLVLKVNDKLYFEVGEILGLRLKVMPMKLLNIFYRMIFKNRKKWEIKDNGQCSVIPKNLKNRFIITK